MPAISTITPTGNIYIDGVLTGVKWATASLTYSFPTDAALYGTGYGSGEPLNNFEAFTPAQQAAVRMVLDNYASVANLTFTEVTETSTQHGDLRYAETDSVNTAWGYYPSTSAAGGDTWFNNTSNRYDNPLVGNYAYLTMLHETGHALGLKHLHEAMGSFGAEPLDHDFLEYSVMSYRSYIGASTTAGYTNGTYSYPQTLMMLDIAAIQEMYGANYTTNSSDTIYKWSSTTGEMFINGVGEGAPGGNKIFMTMWDGGGNDTYDFSNYATNLKVNLSPGGWTTVSATQLANLSATKLAVGNIANALLYHNNTASLIENAIGGSGNDTLIGNIADNKLTGGKGNDAIDGGAGTDTAIYSGQLSNYLLMQNANGTWSITDLRTGSLDGSDTLANVELLQFNDTTITLGTPVAINQAPVAVDDVASVLEDTAIDINVLANDSDPDGNALSIYGLPTALHGTVTVNANGTLHYQAFANYNGVDTIAYAVTDGSLTDAGQVAVTVTAVNDAPKITSAAPSVLLTEWADLSADEAANTPHTASGAITISDADTADTHTATFVARGSGYLGAFSLDPTKIDSNGSIGWSFSVTDNALDYLTAAQTLTQLYDVTVSDGHGGTVTQTVTLTITGAADAVIIAGNTAPTAVDDVASVLEDTAIDINVLANDSDPDGTALSIYGLPTALHGTVTVNANGTLHYQAFANYNGADTIAYSVTDGSLTDAGQVAVTVTAVNDAPVAQSDLYSTAKNTMLKITGMGVLGNDGDADGNTLSALLVGKAAHGTVTLNADGTFNYKPAKNFVGTDSFTYKDSDGSANSNVATVTISVGQASPGQAVAGDPHSGLGMANDQMPAPVYSSAFDGHDQWEVLGMQPHHSEHLLVA